MQRGREAVGHGHRNIEVTSPRHLICSACRLRIRADSPAIALLEGQCPVCGATLAAACAADVIGFRSFDLEALSDRDPGEGPELRHVLAAEAVVPAPERR